MGIHDIQTSFAGGEVAPDLQARVDLAKYKTGLKTLRNFIPSPKGSVSNRPGTFYVATTKDSTKTARLVPFIVSTETAYMLEFGDFYIRFYKNGGQILSGMVAYEVVTPYAYADLPLLKYIQSADVLYLVHPDYRPKTLTRFSDTSWTLADYAFVNGPYRLGNADTSITMSLDVTHTPHRLVSSSAYFFSGMANSLFKIDQFVLNGLISATLTGTSTGTIESVSEIAGGTVSTGVLVSYLPCASTWRFITTGDWVGKVAIQQSIDGGSTWETIQTYVSTGDKNYDTFGDVDISLTNQQPYLIRAVMFTHASGTLNAILRTDAFTYPKYLVLGNYVDSTHMEISSESSDYLGFLSSFGWAEGAWSDYRGWPGTVTFAQDRLVFGGSDSDPQTEWMTKTSNYVDFGRSSPLVDSDGITVNLLSRQVNRIKSLVFFINSILSFTSSSDFSVGSTQDAAITPSTVFTKLQGLRGTGSVDPVLIGSRVIFIEPLGSAVRDLSFQYFTNVFDSENISVSSDHLFKGYTIVDMAYQQEPDSLLWLVRSDGTLLCLTYLREQEVLAWSRHDTNGTFESVATIPGTSANEVWFIVRRGSSRFIERMLLRTQSTDPADQYFVDCGLSYNGVAATSLSGLDYLNGMTVAINAEGFVLPQQTVVGGSITLDKARSKVQVGLPFVSDLETLKPEVPMRDGTSQDRKYQISQSSIRFLNTIGGYVGPDLDTLDALSLCTSPPMREPSLAAATPTPMFSGNVKFTVRRNNDEMAHIAFRQVDPMPVTILGIYPTVESGENP